MTAQRATFTLDSEVMAFLATVAGNNKSAYINRLLREEQRRTLEKAILMANKEEAEDLNYQKELADWDVTLSDGL